MILTEVDCDCVHKMRPICTANWHAFLCIWSPLTGLLTPATASDLAESIERRADAGDAASASDGTPNAADSKRVITCQA